MIRQVTSPPSVHDVLVVGAGQAGLGTAWWLTRTGVGDVVVLDAGQVGDSWLQRWDSLQLFTPRRFSSLPGRRFPAGPTPSPAGPRWPATSAATPPGWGRRCGLGRRSPG